MALSAKHQAFISQYLISFNSTEAYQRVYGPKNRAVAASAGYRLLRNVEIAEAISQHLSESAMTAEEVLNRLADQARASMSDFVRFNDNGDPQLDLQAASVMGKLNLAKKLKTKTRSWSEPTFNLTTGEIEQREVTETAIEFELYDAQAALVHIGKHHKLFTEQVDITSNGETIPISIVKMPVSEL